MITLTKQHRDHLKAYRKNLQTIHDWAESFLLYTSLEEQIDDQSLETTVELADDLDLYLDAISKQIDRAAEITAELAYLGIDLQYCEEAEEEDDEEEEQYPIPLFYLHCLILPFSSGTAPIIC